MLAIGSLTFQHPVIQAALAGYSDWPMRRIAREHGAAGAMNEVVLDRIALAPGKKQRRLVTVRPDDHPIGGQLMGAEPDTIAQAADALVAAGYDWIDINLGCPVRKVLRRGRGGFLLTRPDRALEIIRAVHTAVAGRRPIGVKLRRGMDDTPRSWCNVLAILDGAFAIGIDAAKLHPRTVEQAYLGRADWSYLATAKKRVGDRVILGSGDLFSADDVQRMIDQTGIDGVMLARGCIGNPWLFEQANARLTGLPDPPPPTIEQQGQTLARHLALAIAVHGPRRACAIMRKFGIAYSRRHPDHPAIRDALATAVTVERWLTILARWCRLDALPTVSIND